MVFIRFYRTALFFLFLKIIIIHIIIIIIIIVIIMFQKVSKVDGWLLEKKSGNKSQQYY